MDVSASLPSVAIASGAAGSSRSIVPSISVTLSDGATAEGPTVELLLPVADAAAAVAAASLLASLAAVAANVAFARAALLAGLGRGFLFICRAQASWTQGKSPAERYTINIQTQGSGKRDLLEAAGSYPVDLLCGPLRCASTPDL